LRKVYVGNIFKKKIADNASRLNYASQRNKVRNDLIEEQNCHNAISVALESVE